MTVKVIIGDYIFADEETKMKMLYLLHTPLKNCI